MSTIVTARSARFRMARMFCGSRGYFECPDYNVMPPQSNWEHVSFCVCFHWVLWRHRDLLSPETKSRAPTSLRAPESAGGGRSGGAVDAKKMETLTQERDFYYNKLVRTALKQP